MMNRTPVRYLWILLFAAAVFAGCERNESRTAAADNEAAGENVGVMADEQAADTAGPLQVAVAEPRRPVVSESLAYAEVDDELVYGHFTFPGDMIEPLPAVLVMHEWWGLNDNVRSMAEQLAGEGYIVLAVDLFGGQVANSPEQARQQMLGVVENPDAAAENIRQAYSFVTTTGGAQKVASLGWGFGGAWSLNAAKLFPDELDAAVIYYGQVTDDEDVLRPINAPILGHFGTGDRSIPVDGVRQFEQALERLRKDYEIHYYEGARRAFANPTQQRYDAEAAATAWRRTLEFLSQKLAPASENDAS